jgi:hypothetical protein
MMSAAISMMAGLEQTKAGPATGDLFSGQGELEDASFAKSLSESVRAPASSQGKNAADNLAIRLPGLKGATPTKNLEELADKSGGVTEKPVAAQEMPVPSELKGIVAGKVVPPQATVTGSQEKITASGTGTTKVEVPAQAEGTAADVSAESPIPDAAPVPVATDAVATDESPLPHVGVANGDQLLAPSVLRVDTPVVKRGTPTEEKVTEGVSLKKAVKAQESSANQKTLQKTVGKIADAIAVEPKGVTGISTESAIPAVGQVAAPAVALQGEIGKATDASSKVAFSPTKPATGVSSVAIDGQARKDIALGAKTSVTDTAMTGTAGSDSVATPKTEMSPQRISAVAIAGGSDVENKPQAARESGAALLHSMGIVPTAGVSGITPGELGPTKLAAGDAGPHMAGSPTGSTGRDGAGVVAQSLDGTPRMLAATPTSLEVGIQNGTHGWLKVRAEMADGGVVNASVSAASSAGQEMLHRELPALTAYLQQEKVAVNAVVVHAPSAAGVEARSSSGTDGTCGQTPQRSNEGEQQHQSLRKTILNGSDETVSYRSSHGVDDDGSLRLAAYANGGNWLSVRA